MAKWEINLGADWKPMGNEEATFLEGLWQKKQATGEMNLRGQTYCFDVTAMTQTNMRSKKARSIRRVGPPDEGAKGASKGSSKDSKAGYPSGAAAGPSSAASEMLYDERKKHFWERGKGFRVYMGGKWQDFAPTCQDLLEQAYTEGCPSMRLNVKGHMHKFDFVKMEMKNMNTLEKGELRVPDGLERKGEDTWLFSKEAFWNPLTKGREALKQKVAPQRPVFIVRVPKDGPGKVIEVPHPKKLGRAMQVAVPKDANIGDPLFIEVPRTSMRSKMKYATGGAAGGAAGVGGIVLGIEVAEGAALAGGAAAAGAGGAAAAAAAGPIIAGLAVGGIAVAGAGAAVHYATKHPGKAIAIGALTIGGLALAAHIEEVGLVDAISDVADGAKDMVEAVPDVVEGIGDALDDVGDALEDIGEAVGDAAEDLAEGAEDLAEDVLDVGEWIADAGEDCVDIILDLF